MTVWIAVIAVGLLCAAAGAGAVRSLREDKRTPPSRQLDQTDPIVVAAVREVDALIPALPILDPEVVRREARVATAEALHKAQAIKEAAAALEAERRFFERPAVAKPSDIYVVFDAAKDEYVHCGRRIPRVAIERYGWEAAIMRARQEGAPFARSD